MLKFLIMGNVRRGGVYPLCVGAERVLQAQTIAQMALSLKTQMVAHGCTAAGNDQVRFEVALRTLAPDLEIIAPVRDRAFKRPEQLKYLEDHAPADSALRRGLLGESRAVGRHHRRQGDAHLGRQHSGGRLGAVEGCVLRSRAPPERHTMGFDAGVPAESGRRRTVRRSPSSRSWKLWPAPSASAAAFTWATPSSAPRDGSPSKRRPPMCC